MAAVKENNPQKLNFFTASFLGIMGLSLSSEIFMEDDRMDKIDDVLFLILGLAAVYWYKKSAHKNSLMPVILVVVGMAIKIFAIVVEIGDKEAVGDDFGINIALVLALVFVIYQYLKLRKTS